MEEFDVYNDKRETTGVTFQKGRTFAKGEYHLITHLCIFNSAGEMLIQQRHSSKGKWPNLWDVTVGGKVAKGETSQQGIQREVKEELGLEIDFTKVRPHLTLNYEFGFDDFYLIEQDVIVEELILEDDEVKAVRWAGRETILAMMQQGEFVPYYPNLINLLFDMRKKYGYIHHT